MFVLRQKKLQINKQLLLGRVWVLVLREGSNSLVLPITVNDG